MGEVKKEEKKLSFSSDKVKSYFMKLCRASEREVVVPDWKKFRSLDAKGIFSKIPNNRLSMNFRKLNLMSKGLCYMCGVEEASGPNKPCEKCYTYLKRMTVEAQRAKRLLKIDRVDLAPKGVGRPKKNG